MSELEPITREEELLNSIADGTSSELSPITRREIYLSAIAGESELPSDMKPITREEMYYQKIIDNGGGGGSKASEFYYDFTKSYDEQNIGMPNLYVEGTNISRDSNGVLISGGSSASVKVAQPLNGCIVDVVTGDLEKLFDNSHGRLINMSNITNSEGNGIIYRSTGAWCVYNNNQWKVLENIDASDPTALANKKITIDMTDISKTKIYVDDTLVMSDQNFSSLQSLRLGGGSSVFYNAVFKSLRIRKASA